MAAETTFVKLWPNKVLSVALRLDYIFYICLYLCFGATVSSIYGCGVQESTKDTKDWKKQHFFVKETCFSPPGMIDS